MPLSSYRMHRIYLAATMNYGLGSNDPEELSYYNKIRKEMDDMKQEPFKSFFFHVTHLFSDFVVVGQLFMIIRTQTIIHGRCKINSVHPV